MLQDKDIDFDKFPTSQENTSPKDLAERNSQTVAMLDTNLRRQSHSGLSLMTSLHIVVWLHDCLVALIIVIAG
ncbi:hypothetical protein PWF83_20245 (plasmid) [Pantoea dispersa]|uniref:hypothetical protein n=1 Tax=Pantoea dispersa TaxID=59814 RepID=UPI0021C69138|nr:hypothetical protein [Pantoea dispersa]MDI9767344.1 hypothetical protein [Pantoea dispersa]WEA08249.1 hypothetical protein PWF83_20245 [Pantoea dispersa]